MIPIPSVLIAALDYSSWLMLHVLNGDATAMRLAPAALPGEVLVWRDILVEGLAEAETEIATLAERRAPWLARRFGISPDRYIESGRAQAAGLSQARDHDEIVLWFEQDLFCVANLGHLAAWLERTRPAARVSLVFPADPLGTMTAGALAELFAARRPFSARDVARAASWWRALGAPTPPAWIEPADDGALAFLPRAWRLHLARFPSVSTGLGVVETAGVAAVGDGVRGFADVFREASADARIRGHGMSDLQLAASLHALAEGPSPLVRIRADGPAEQAPLGEDAIRTWTISLTGEGRDVRDGRRDRVEMQALDWWLGGVRLEGRHARFRWDEGTERLIEGSPQA
jgi:hypothetical protein